MKDFKADYAGLRAQCGAQAVPLRMIGNEASLCRADQGAQRQGARVVGRVRDRALTVTVSTTTTAGQFPARAMMEKQACGIAEQVAGAMF